MAIGEPTVVIQTRSCPLSKNPNPALGLAFRPFKPRALDFLYLAHALLVPSSAYPGITQWASSWGRPKRWRVKGARVVPYEPWTGDYGGSECHMVKSLLGTVEMQVQL